MKVIKEAKKKKPYSSMRITTGDINANVAHFNKSFEKTSGYLNGTFKNSGAQSPDGASTVAAASSGGEGGGMGESLINEDKRYVRRYYIRPQNMFCSNKAEILKALIELDDENCSVYTLNNLDDNNDITKLSPRDIIYYYDNGILYDKNHVKVMDYDLYVKHEEDRKKIDPDNVSDAQFNDVYDDRMTDQTVVEATEHLINNYLNESVNELDGDFAVVFDNAIVIPQANNELNEVVVAATNVMETYQNANKWLDSVKEVIYTRFNCPFFSSFVHELAHTMPGRFDKFGDILHTVNMEIPYPETKEIAKKPANIDEAFTLIFIILDNIKSALNDFIKLTDEKYHGMSCAAEALLNDIESEYPMLYRLQAKAKECGEDTTSFDKFVGQYVEHKGDLLESYGYDAELNLEFEDVDAYGDKMTDQTVVENLDEAEGVRYSKGDKLPSWVQKSSAISANYEADIRKGLAELFDPLRKALKDVYSRENLVNIINRPDSIYLDKLDSRYTKSAVNATVIFSHPNYRDAKNNGYLITIFLDTDKINELIAKIAQKNHNWDGSSNSEFRYNIENVKEYKDVEKGLDDAFNSTYETLIEVFEDRSSDSSYKYNNESLKESQSQEIGVSYDELSKKYHIDLEDLVYGEDGFMDTRYPEGFPDFAGDVIYSEKYWNEFKDWASSVRGIKIDDTNNSNIIDDILNDDNEFNLAFDDVNAYGESLREGKEVNGVCCICGEEINGYGNSPEPYKSTESGRCCDACYKHYVAPAADEEQAEEE